MQTEACPPNDKNACALFVTFHPAEECARHLLEVARQVDRVVVVDNSATDVSQKLLRQWLASIPNSVLILNSENVGQATALNQGAEYAIEAGYNWLLTFDQDTTPFPDLLQTLITAYGGIRNRSRIGMLGSNYVDEHDRPRFRSPNRRTLSIPRDAVITSGALLPLAAYRSVGRFRDDFFIDSVDREYCFRLRQAGYSVRVTTTPTMRHGWGSPRQYRVGPLSVTTTNHSPLRRYYIARNLLQTVLLHRGVPGSCAVAGLAAAVDLARSLVFEQNRSAKLAATCFGLFDGVAGRMGPARPSLCT